MLVALLVADADDVVDDDALAEDEGDDDSFLPQPTTANPSAMVAAVNRTIACVVTWPITM